MWVLQDWTCGCWLRRRDSQVQISLDAGGPTAVASGGHPAGAVWMDDDAPARVPSSFSSADRVPKSGPLDEPYPHHRRRGGGGGNRKK